MSDASLILLESPSIYEETDPVRVESMISRIFGGKAELTPAERAELRNAYAYQKTLQKRRLGLDAPGHVGVPGSRADTKR